MKKLKIAIAIITCIIIVNIIMVIGSFIAFGCTYDMSFKKMTIADELLQLYGLLFIPFVILLLMQMIVFKSINYTNKKYNSK